ncbi:MAG: hypothetical protein ACOX47_13380 [Bacillota bacterium]|jgi:hypothetical protein
MGSQFIDQPGPSPSVNLGTVLELNSNKKGRVDDNPVPLSLIIDFAHIYLPDLIMGLARLCKSGDGS